MYSPRWEGRNGHRRSWSTSGVGLEGRSAEESRVTIQEPGVVELKDDRLKMVSLSRNWLAEVAEAGLATPE